MKKPRLRPLADLVSDCLAPALAAKGFAATDIVVAWPDIVGDRLAPWCEPVTMRWPRPPVGVGDERQEPATLVVRVEGAFALELQHAAPVIIERINARYGWRCVGRMSLRQGPMERRAEPPRKPAPVSPAALEQARARVADVADEALREALVRLGAGILSREAG